MVNMSTMASAEKPKEVIYLGELTYNKKWLGENLSEDERKDAVLRTVKAAFDKEVYCGLRCNGENCGGEQCAKFRAMRIVMVKHTQTETSTTTTRSIMLHAYQTGPEGEGVFQRLCSPQGEPMKLILNAFNYNKETEQLKLACKGHFAPVMDLQRLSEIRHLMREAMKDTCPADAIILQSEDYVDNEQ